MGGEDGVDGYSLFRIPRGSMCRLRCLVLRGGVLILGEEMDMGMGMGMLILVQG